MEIQMVTTAQRSFPQLTPAFYHSVYICANVTEVFSEQFQFTADSHYSLASPNPPVRSR